MVDLENVAGEDHFGVFAGAGDDGLDFMRCQVLGFVNDKVSVDEAAAADIGQRGDHEFFLIEQFLEFFGPAFGGVDESVLDHAQVVIQRLHVRADFFIHTAREVSEVFIGKGHDRARQEDLFVIVALFQGGGEREECFAGAGLAGYGDQAQVIVHQGVEGKNLFDIARLDTRGVVPGDMADHHVGRVDIAQRGHVLVARHHAFIGQKFCPRLEFPG